MTDPKLHFPATERNRGPIFEALEPRLPARGLVLEIASGSGEHVAWFAPRTPRLVWQPSDPGSAHRASIAAWTAELDNVRPPLDLDVERTPWPLDHADAVYCANMIHIAPWSATPALLDGAARLLEPGGRLFLYGPFMMNGQHTSPSNAQFDDSLQARDPSWGVRDLDEVAALAAARGLRHTETVAMPANNFLIVFERQSA